MAINSGAEVVPTPWGSLPALMCACWEPEMRSTYGGRSCFWATMLHALYMSSSHVFQDRRVFPIKPGMGRRRNSTMVVCVAGRSWAVGRCWHFFPCLHTREVRAIWESCPVGISWTGDTLKPALKREPGRLQGLDGHRHGTHAHGDCSAGQTGMPLNPRLVMIT